MRDVVAGVLVGALAVAWGGPCALAQSATTASTTQSNSAGDQQDLPLKQQIIDLFPDAISQGLDLGAWAWVGDLANDVPHTDDNNFYDLEFSLAVSETFDERLKIAAQGNFIDADGIRRGELEQGYITGKIFENAQTFVTVGKFNADFGVEPRDFWNRSTGTTSLLFAAQPQDLIGAMVTQPIGDSGLTVRPYLSEDFQGGYVFDQSPSAGISAQYKPDRILECGLTGWVGPGFVDKGGKPLHPPFNDDSYDDSYAGVVDNWQGPNMYGQRASTLYFGEGEFVVRPNPELAISGELLMGATSSRGGRWGWSGYMIMADYRVTDPLHVFARWSALDDSDWIITGMFQRLQEASCGFGYQFLDGLEGRFEYRHDFSNIKPQFDTLSVNLAWSF